MDHLLFLAANVAQKSKYSRPRIVDPTSDLHQISEATTNMESALDILICKWILKVYLCHIWCHILACRIWCQSFLPYAVTCIYYFHLWYFISSKLERHLLTICVINSLCRWCPKWESPSRQLHWPWADKDCEQGS